MSDTDGPFLGVHGQRCNAVGIPALELRGRFQRLPKWAQSEPDRLARLLNEAREEMAVGPEDSDTFLVTGFDMPDRPLGTRVTISHSQEADHRRAVRVTFAEGQIRVEAWSGSLVVCPKSTNSVTLRSVPHD